MPILKKTDPIPKRPVIIVIYGEPGIGKTSLFNTSAEPLLIDFDRGKDRAIFRQDTLVVNDWNELLADEKAGTFKQYKTVGIDTAKACLDDFLMSYVVAKDIKNQRNKQAAYGALGDEFKVFVSNRRSEAADIVILAHSKDKEYGDISKKIPDVTGGSYQLLLRIADQVGYMTTVNNRRTIQFEPTDTTIGKNVARLPLIEIPDHTDPRFKTFMANLIEDVKEAICSQSEAQREALELQEALQRELVECETPEQLTEMLVKVNGLDSYLKIPFQKLIGEKAKAKGYVANKEKKCFELPLAKQEQNNTAAEASGAREEKEILPTSLDDRCMILGQLGMAMEVDRAVIGGLAITYIHLEALKEEEFNDFVVKVGNEAKKAKKKNGSRRTGATA